MKTILLSARTTSATDAAFWGGVLILAVVILAVSLWYLRRRLFSASSQSSDEDLFSLQHLRQLLAKGQITRDEFERLKASALDAARTAPTGKSSGRAKAAPDDAGGPNGVK